MTAPYSTPSSDLALPARMQDTLSQAASESDALQAAAVGTEASENAVGNPEPMVTLSATLGYKGAAFAGFARQPAQLTVQGELEAALTTIFATPVTTVCAGRTDAGVHARGQVVSFEVPASALERRTLPSLVRSLNALTHEDITVRTVERRADGFSARFDAVQREYRYYICVDPQPSLFMADFSWHIDKPLDLKAMALASRSLIGEHDFKSFCLAVSAEGKTTMRNVSQIAFDRTEIMGEHFLVITVRGNAFLHSMVRTIVGSLVMVGRGQRPIDWLDDVLAAKDRSSAGPNAPAQGLVFWRVEY